MACISRNHQQTRQEETTALGRQHSLTYPPARAADNLNQNACWTGTVICPTRTRPVSEVAEQRLLDIWYDDLSCVGDMALC